MAINALPIKTWELLSKAQVVLNNASQVSFPLERHGQGTQSVTTILLFKAYIDILLAELNTANAEAILMIEEPEAHLHPQATQAIEKVIQELRCQKILTTHSPYFLQNVNLLNIRLFKKVNGKTEAIKIIDKITIPLTEIPESLCRMAPHYDNILELNEEKKTLIIHKPIFREVARALKGVCKEDGIDDYILKSRDIFITEELNSLNMYVQRTRGEILFARKWILYEGQTEEVIIRFCAEKLGYNLEQYGISGVFYRTNGSAGAFVKLARILGIEWVLLGDRDLQGRKTIGEIRNCGYSQEEIAQKVFLTSEKDIENEFAKNGFLADYETIVSDIIDDDVKKLKEDGKDNEYKEAIISIVQAGKVEYAYKLIDVWKTRNMQKEEIPDFIKKFIGEVCKNG